MLVSSVQSSSTYSASILIVDRDETACSKLAHELEMAMPSHPSVASARSGKTAAEILKTNGFDLIVLDASSLSDLGATEEESVARLAKLAGDALTVVLSDGGSVSAAVSAMRAGAHDSLARPVTGAALALRVAELARRHGKARPLTLSPTGTHSYNNAGGRPGVMTAADLGGSRRQAILPMWRQEQKIIEDAIATFSGNISLAAAALELSPSTIYRKRQAWAEMQDGANGAA
jgi:DNA-binding NtrC family response regulator